ncbi:hypothetical protein, partial [Methanoculleus sp.]|uniref:hypothetical protein n=1 Tax=Methanoculleus sp. TaxID=90427 RepID=UPI0025FF88B6
KLKELTIAGVAAAYGSKTSDDYADDLEAVLIRNSAYNIVEYNNKKGYFVLTEVDIPDTVENQNAREFSGTGKFLPAARYECSYRVETDYVESDLAIQFPPIIALPTGATNVRIKSPWEIMFIDEWHGTVGSDGKISIFKPFPIFDADNYVTASSTGDKTYMESAYGCFVTVLNAQNKKTEWTTTVGTDLPKGRYKIVFRLQDLNVADDISVTVTGNKSGELINEIFTTGKTTWTTIETSEFEVITHETLSVSIKKVKATTNTINVNYGFILPTYTAKVVFENDTEVDCGNVKVFDTNGSTTESEWKQVFNYNHDFSTGIVIQNSFFRWHVDTNEVWDNTGELTNLINNQVGRLYPRAFKNNDVSYIVKEIRPDLVEIEFSLFDGESDAGATDCREIVLARFTPLYVTFELIRNGTFKWDWHVDFSTMTSWKAINAPSDLMVKKSLSNTEHTSENGIFTVIFDECIVGICKSKNSSSLVLGEGGLYVNNTAESGNFMFTLFMISGSLGSEYIFQNTSGVALSNVQSNRIFDNFAIDSSAEYDVENGSNFTETYSALGSNGLLISSSSDILITKKLKNLKLGTGKYKLMFTIHSQKTITREAGIIIAGDPTYDNTYYVCCLELDATQSGGGNLSKVKLLKFNQNQDIHGSYGVDGYGLFGYGAVQEEVVAAVKTVTAGSGITYFIECEYNNENRSFEIYFFRSGTSKPSTPTITYVGDEAFEYGNVGLFARVSSAGTDNIYVNFDYLDITGSMIYDNVGYPFTVITGPSHGGMNGYQRITIFDGIIGEDIDVGRYNIIVQTISTSEASELNFSFVNATDSTSLAIDTTATYEKIGGDAVLTTYNHVIEFKESDIGDNAVIIINKTISGYYPLNLITYAALIPISNTEGSEIITPTNLSFASFNEQNYYRNLEPKEFGSNLLNRKYKAYR